MKFELGKEEKNSRIMIFTSDATVVMPPIYRLRFIFGMNQLEISRKMTNKQ